MIINSAALSLIKALFKTINDPSRTKLTEYAINMIVNLLSLVTLGNLSSLLKSLSGSLDIIDTLRV